VLKILFDIGHPAHFHFFSEIIQRLKNANHDVLLVIREKDCTRELVEGQKLKFISRGKGAGGFTGRMFYLMKMFFFFRKIIRNEKPDIVVSFGSPYTALVRAVMKFPLILVTDAEPNKTERFFFKWPDVIITPDSFQHDYGEKHLCFRGTKELAYLSKDSIMVNPDSQDYVLVRFVEHGAMHYKGLRHNYMQMREQLIGGLVELMSVQISSEENLSLSMQPYVIDEPSDLLHTKIANARIVVTESATVAAEAAVLGVPVIMISSLYWGYIRQLESLGVIIKREPGMDYYTEAVTLAKSVMDGKVEYPDIQEFLDEADDVNHFVISIIEKTVHEWKS